MCSFFVNLSEIPTGCHFINQKHSIFLKQQISARDFCVFTQFYQLIWVISISTGYKL